MRGKARQPVSAMSDKTPAVLPSATVEQCEVDIADGQQSAVYDQVDQGKHRVQSEPNVRRDPTQGVWIAKQWARRGGECGVMLLRIGKFPNSRQRAFITPQQVGHSIHRGDRQAPGLRAQKSGNRTFADRSPGLPIIRRGASVPTPPRVTPLFHKGAAGPLYPELPLPTSNPSDACAVPRNTRHTNIPIPSSKSRIPTHPHDTFIMSETAAIGLKSRTDLRCASRGSSLSGRASLHQHATRPQSTTPIPNHTTSWPLYRPFSTLSRDMLALPVMPRAPLPRSSGNVRSHFSPPSSHLINILHHETNQRNQTPDVAAAAEVGGELRRQMGGTISPALTGTNRGQRIESVRGRRQY
ncbi:hypothetical protein CTheo_4759 [Ceratobasidium theobromae]|uniref:Uncharacterized protein n=1 Tax=Ceratobasidium theobromae TaxID=1582974 RepID=A0A5N5QJU8_9AGAM|nr:hypothetical protein CTheo_4759 [Ceratobasidium theobromae]